jgi:murein DD-endopeptidase MepM/ murein hydrolase activator NlpD
VIAGETAAAQEVQLEAVPPTPQPFRLTLPTPGAEPVSGWRPPLYPVPWALTAYDHFYFVRPIAADEVNWPLPDYRYGGIFFAGNIVHTGVDIDAADNAPVYAAGPGTVVWAGWGLFTESPGNESDPYGLAVAIRHDFGYKGQQLYTIYAHMSKITTVIGQHLEAGDQLGLVGSTGATTGPHLHFEVRLPNNSFHDTYNPELWIAPPQGWGVLVGRVMDTKGKTLQQLEIFVKSENRRESRIVKTYGGGGAINHDPYYDENVVLGDLPAGIYRLTLRFDDKDRQTWVEIYPGQVTFFTFEGENGFDTTRPPAPTLDFLPSPVPTATSTP